MSEREATGSPPQHAVRLRTRMVVLLLVAAAFAVLLVVFRHELSLTALAAREEQLRAWHRANPLLALGAAFALYVLVTGLSLPGATGMSLVYGWLFSFWPALILVSFASTTGAAIAFLLSRYLFGEVIQTKYHDQLAAFNRALEREGAFYLFALRLMPAVPFFVINLVMGLTPMRVRTYWWVSQLGMLPGTCLYVFAGSSLPNLAELAERGAGSVFTPPLIIAFVLLGIFPLVARKIIQRVRS